MGTPDGVELSYVLPLRASHPRRDLAPYLQWLAPHVEVIVVDSSPSGVFAAHREMLPAQVRHVPLAPGGATLNGKVGAVMTGVALASHDRVVIADDDVTYALGDLHRTSALLATHDVVRPQNWFDPLPWHARWDTGRVLCNRALGGDWPGTLAVRRSVLLSAGGYAGDVLFENFELVQTVEAAGGRACLDLSLLVRRRPPELRQFVDQRVRQAYDEFARPWRLAVFLAVAPTVVATRGRAALPLAVTAVTVAEVGRRRDGGTRVFPATSAAWAPAWLAERAVTSWLAVASRIVHGGVRYRGQVVRRAATPRRELARRVHQASGHTDGHAILDAGRRQEATWSRTWLTRGGKNRRLSSRSGTCSSDGWSSTAPRSR